MGTNKRYPHMSMQRLEESQLRAARKRGPLHSLTHEQLRLDRSPVTIVPEREKLWGLAWLRFGDVDVQCTILVRRWTADAVGVELSLDDEVLRCWIWQGACQRISERTEAWT